MKRTINGIVCDTLTATEIIVEGHGLSPAWWGLYRTPDGSFFKIVVDLGGKISEWTLPAAKQARQIVRKHAPHMTEKFFGSARDTALDECRLTVQMPLRLARQIEAMAAGQGVDVDDYVMQSLEKTLGQKAYHP